MIVGDCPFGVTLPPAAVTYWDAIAALVPNAAGTGTLVPGPVCGPRLTGVLFMNAAVIAAAFDTSGQGGIVVGPKGKFASCSFSAHVTRAC
jgi:hypothetical protein